MNRIFPLVCLFVSISVATAYGQQPENIASSATGAQGAVAAGRQTAVAAGIEILRGGGNAVDAAVATILAQSVVKSRSFCFGGEVPIIVYNAQRDVIEVLCGQGAAPKLATLEWFQKNKDGKIPRGDPAGATVPAVLHACLTALDRHGTMTFAQVSGPMLRALDRDEPAWNGDLARHVKRAIEAESRAADRKRGLAAVTDYFHRGPAARQLAEWSAENGGLIRYEDLANHVTRIEEPLAVEYRGFTIYKCGPWTQGPCLLQTLRLLEGFDLKSLGRDNTDYIHTVVEALKLALADRDTYYADPLHVDVPIQQLLSDDYTTLRRSLIDGEKASHEQRPGDPRAGKALLGISPEAYQVPAGPDNDTTTCLVADRWGNVVAATPSGWGGVVAGRTGIVLGTRLISLNTWKGHPNCIAPGKRPRITLTPTLVFKDGKPVFAISVAGGDLQDQTTLQVLLNYIEFGCDPTKAVTAARFSTAHHIGSFNQPPPQLGSLSVNPGISDNVMSELASRGHDINKVNGAIAMPIAISINPQTGQFHAAGDPRAGRHAAAY